MGGNLEICQPEGQSAALGSTSLRVPKSPGDKTPSTDREGTNQGIPLSFPLFSIRVYTVSVPLLPKQNLSCQAQDLFVPPTLAGRPCPRHRLSARSRGQVSTFQSLSAPPAACSSLGSACILGRSPALCPLSLALGLRRSLNFLLKS